MVAFTVLEMYFGGNNMNLLENLPDQTLELTTGGGSVNWVVAGTQFIILFLIYEKLVFIWIAYLLIVINLFLNKNEKKE